MNEAYVVAIEGLADTRAINDLPKNILVAAQRAINRTADRSATDARRRTREQVNFPAQYLTGTDSGGRQRLGISRRAGDGNLEAVITGRQRATSLARFVTSGVVGKQGVTVQVAPGFARLMRRAFLIRLPAGNQLTETKGNLGLAIRLKPGETIQNKRAMIRVKGNLYLLYGPSVDQVFNTVREDVAPDAEQFLAGEFLRLMELDL